MLWRLSLVITSLLCVLPCPAQDKLAARFPNRQVSLTCQGEPLAQVLQRLQKASGIPLRDNRSNRTPAPITLHLKEVSFWQALEEIAKQVPARLSPYAGEGTVALLDAAGPTPPVSLHGPFRSSLRQVSVTNNLETGQRYCVVHLDVTWEPGLQPLLLALSSYRAEFAPAPNAKPISESVTGGSFTPLNGRPGTEIELRLKAPPRTVLALQKLEGTLSVIGPLEMLTARFAKLAPRTEKINGIEVALQRFSIEEKNRWLVEMRVTQPAGGPSFESYQSWIANNRLLLERRGSGDKFDGEVTETILEMTQTRAVIQYNLVEKAGGQRLGQPADWTLTYRTAGRIIEAQVPFRFQEVQLP